MFDDTITFPCFGSDHAFLLSLIIMSRKLFILFYFIFFFSFKSCQLTRLHPAVATHTTVPLTMLVEHFVGIIILLIVS